MIALPAIVSTEQTFVVVLADLGGSVQSIPCTAWQESCARVTTYCVVASLRWQATVLPHLTLVNVHASLSQIVTSETNFAIASVASHYVNAVFVTTTRVLYFPTLVNVNAAAIPDEPTAVRAFLIRRRWKRCRGRRRFLRHGHRRFRAGVAAWLIVAELAFADVRTLGTLVHVVADLICSVITITRWTDG